MRKQLIAQGQYLLGEPEAEEKVDEKLILHKVDGSGATASHFNPFKDIGHG